MKTVILLPTNKRAKQLIKEHGEEWEFIQTQKVQCFNDEGIMIKSLNGKHFRWVRKQEVIIDEKYIRNP